MKEFWNVTQLAFTAVGGWLGWFLGGVDGLIYTEQTETATSVCRVQGCALSCYKANDCNCSIQQTGEKEKLRKIP